MLDNRQAFGKVVRAMRRRRVFLGPDQECRQWSRARLAGLTEG